MADIELRSKTELTSIAGTENIYVQEAGTPFTVKRTLFNTIRSWIMTAPGSTVLKTSSYSILDNDGYTRIEVDTSSAAVTITLPLMSNNRGRRIEIAFIKNDVSADVVTISPHATDANKLSGDLLGSIILAKVGDFIVLQESVNSGCWEVINERISCSLELDTYAGFGSTDNKIMRFTNIPITFGNMFSENHSTGYSGNTKGIEITINRSGRYSASLTVYAPQSSYYGFSVDSNQLTTSIASITLLHRKAILDPTGGQIYGCQYDAIFSKGQVLRIHTDGSAPTSASISKLFVNYLG